MAITFETNNGVITFKGKSGQPVKEKNVLLAPLNKMISNYGLQFELLPTAEQQKVIDKTIGCARVVANDYYAVKSFLYSEYGERISQYDYRTKYYPILCEEKPWLREMHRHSVLSGTTNMEDAFNRFFSGKAKYPKIVTRGKPNGQRYNTPNDHESIRLSLKDGIPYISVPKAGKVRFIMPWGKTIESILPDKNTHIKSITVIHDGTGYHVSLQMETIVDLVNPIKTVNLSSIGAMDMGLKHFGIYGNKSSTDYVDNPRWIRKSEKQLRRAQKRLSRKYEAAKREGRNYWEGRNYQKAKARVVKLQKHITNQRKDFHHKLSRLIADAYDIFVFENLNIRGLLKNHHLAKEISSVGWYQFQQFVSYKLQRKGGMVFKIDRFFPSSKNCSVCGYKKEDMKLNDRFWYCPNCHTLHDRDANAKENILNEGIRLIKETGITILPA